ncbi:hypothetical protein DTO212C5_8784 [Paecilomyces variotii]|nr:hypothetical protein DTO212C5_8784 [Paecilomyces variotii]
MGEDGLIPNQEGQTSPRLNSSHLIPDRTSGQQDPGLIGAQNLFTELCSRLARAPSEISGMEDLDHGSGHG